MDYNNDWLYDYLLQFLKSAGWKVPILEFIDQYCYQFEDSNENKLVYTEIHNVIFTQKFKELIDGLLDNICVTLGITHQQFFKTCETGVKNPSHRRVFEQILACDNFISFKKLMIKRNKELEVEASKQGEFKKPQPANQEKAELDLAKSLSLRELEERKKLEEKYNEELRLALKLSEAEINQKLKTQGELNTSPEVTKDKEEESLNALKLEQQKLLEMKTAEEKRIALEKKLKEDELKKTQLTLAEQSLAKEKLELELERQKIFEEAKRLEAEKLELQQIKEEKRKSKLLKQKTIEEDKQIKEEQEKRKAEEEEKIRLRNLELENRKLEEMLREKARKSQIEAKKKEEQIKSQESKLNTQNFEKELSYDESTESEVKKIQDLVFKQQETEVSVRVKSSLPSIHGRMPFNSSSSIVSEDLSLGSAEKAKVETLQEREARLKMQRALLLEKKKAERQVALNDYIADGGTDLTVKAKPTLSAEELEKRRQTLIRIKHYNED